MNEVYSGWQAGDVEVQQAAIAFYVLFGQVVCPTCVRDDDGRLAKFACSGNQIPLNGSRCDKCWRQIARVN